MGSLQRQVAFFEHVFIAKQGQSHWVCPFSFCYDTLNINFEKRIQLYSWYHTKGSMGTALPCSRASHFWHFVFDNDLHLARCALIWGRYNVRFLSNSDKNRTSYLPHIEAHLDKWRALSKTKCPKWDALPCSHPSFPSMTMTKPYLQRPVFAGHHSDRLWSCLYIERKSLQESFVWSVFYLSQ